MNVKFLAEYIKHPRTIGAVTPSSKYLAQKMIENIDFEHCTAIAEYGAYRRIYCGGCEKVK